jgi:SAM-dependent methyltransferase
MHGAEILKLAELETRHWWYAERRAVLERLLGRHQGRGWAADVGAAAGGNTGVLTNLGWQALALEYSEVGAALAHQKGHATCRADAQVLPVRTASLGLVVALDLLEHLPDDGAAAREMRRVLRPDGTLVVSVPADPRLWSAHDEAVSHLRRYTRESLETLLCEAGFEVQRLWSWNVLMRPLLAARRRSSTGSDLRQLSAPLNAILRAVVCLERYLPLSDLPGVSLFALCTPVPTAVPDYRAVVRSTAMSGSSAVMVS